MPVEHIRDLCGPIVKLARIVLPSGEELTALTGAASPEKGAEELLSSGVEIVALKQGAQGSTIYSSRGALRIPAFTVTEVDPTGAGDCYDAAFLVGIDAGWPIDRVGLFANAAGALATTRLGPMEGAFSREHVLAFMASQGRALEI
jgi:sugar/nucleoside kinase (ribokinase family)